MPENDPPHQSKYVTYIRDSQGFAIGDDARGD